MKAALAHGDFVAAVGRTSHDTIANILDMQTITQLSSPFDSKPKTPTTKASEKATTAGGEGDPPSPYLPLLCDVRLRSTVDAAFRTALEYYGRIDIIANCSGYGIIGACEDQLEHEIRDQFQTNFFGTLYIIQASLPYFRERKEGRYLIFSSTAGSLGVPGLGPYCATKYAVEGLVESMLYETAVYNVRAVLVAPGHVRRDDHPPPFSPTTTNPALRLPSYGHFLVKPASAAYASPTAPARHAIRVLQWMGDKQPTSAVKLGEVVWQLGHCTYPPLRLFLGAFAVESVRDRMKSVMEEIEDWKHLNFPSEEEGAAREKEGEDGEDRGVREEGGAEQEDEDMDDEEEEGEEGERVEEHGDFVEWYDTIAGRRGDQAPNVKQESGAYGLGVINYSGP